ncbi:RILP-like protein 1 isoform X2 [Biomphalaria glabrata]|uniref:RILP-like protein 1 isoform X2 n=1 Tax=Biomphalaria glabrata TaxID=6526 RepID=A0A9W2YEM2_BIOGL|nr:RILP-like protein 1 isoform X2 [Biomphalaria glabrata]
MDVRRCLFSARIMASEEIQAISVTDVYDQAAGIAHEFDKLIQNYGNDSVTELMPRVIRSLELLETLASRYEHDVEEINQLRYRVEKLETEKTEKAQERAKFDQELEAIEENWQSEVKELLEVVNRLQDENKRLKDNARSEKHAAVAEFAAKRIEAEEEEIKVLTKLKETVDKQREEIRAMKRELGQKGVDCDALQAQLERIAKVNADLRRKNSTHKKQARALIEEKVDLETQLHTKDAEVEHIKKIMVEQEKYDEQRAAVKAVVEASKSIEEEEESGETCNEPIKQQISKATTTTSATETEHVMSPGSPGFDLEGKLVIDLKDPNRPRFTLHELRQVLMERNELKTRLIEVEDELAHYKPREDSSAQNEGRDYDEKSSYTGEEVLVYGPINKEPDEKVGIKKESGIRKFSFTKSHELVRGIAEIFSSFGFLFSSDGLEMKGGQRRRNTLRP